MRIAELNSTAKLASLVLRWLPTSFGVILHALEKSLALFFLGGGGKLGVALLPFSHSVKLSLHFVGYNSTQKLLRNFFVFF